MKKQIMPLFSSSRRDALVRTVTLAAAAATGYTAPAYAQSAYPNRSIRLLVAVAPGGPTDSLARMIGQKLTEAWGQPVVIENKPGAGQAIGTNVAAKAAPDGYTLLMTTNTLAVNPWMFKNLPYDAKKDFTPITQVASSSLVLIANPSVPVTTLQELLNYARKYPGKLNYGSSGPSSSLRLAVELIKSMAHIDMVHVPFHGAGPLMTAILGNVVQIAVVDVPTAKPHIKSGMVRGIAVTSDHREPSLPNLPTMSESGLPGYTAESWFGLIAPKGIPKPIVDQIQAEVAKILQMQDVVSTLKSHGEEPIGSSPEAFAAFIDSELTKWRKVVEDGKISVQ